MSLTIRRLSSLAALTSALFVGACSDDGGTTEPEPAVAPTVAVTSTGTSTATVTITGRAGDNSFVIERVAGATGGTFAQVGTATASATGTATYNDTGLSANAPYRYRVATVRGSQTSSFSAEQSVTTRDRSRIDLTGDITASRTLYSDTVYVIKGFVHVLNGATLTIQAGTRLEGDFNTLGSSLFIMRGAKISAIGRADAPIVFTSSRAAGQRQPGDWGGLIIIGNGVINRTGAIKIEGTNTQGASGPGQNYEVTYGGQANASNDDDSGELRYVRVEFAGFGPLPNEELNSFTFAAVGNRTKLSYLQSMAGLDDSFEWFGGAADADHLVSYESGDDHFDMSEGYSGRLQYLIAFQSTVLTPRGDAGQPSADPVGIENDGCNGTGCAAGFNSTPFTIPVVANFTLVGTGSTASSGASGGYGMVLRRGSGGHYVNGVIARWPRGAIAVRDADTYARAGNAATPDLTTADLAIRNVLTAESASLFQTGTGTFSFDAATNALTAGTTTTASLFTAFPATVNDQTTAAAFDWTPAGAAATTAGLGTFSGKLATRVTAPLGSGNGAVAGTAYVGAAQPGGTKWWSGWTIYAQK